MEFKHSEPVDIAYEYYYSQLLQRDNWEQLYQECKTESEHESLGRAVIALNKWRKDNKIWTYHVVYRCEKCGFVGDCGPQSVTTAYNNHAKFSRQHQRCRMLPIGSKFSQNGIEGDVVCYEWTRYKNGDEIHSGYYVKSNDSTISLVKLS